MKYDNIQKGTFISRSDRFTALIDIGSIEKCHIKSTGRLSEILVEGADVFVEEKYSPSRKTKHDVISAYKRDRLINIDSLAPNALVYSYLPILFPEVKYIKPEAVFHNSRFDFYVETDKDKIFIEVKGVTQEDNFVAMFPDAPTLRGLKHIYELCDCIDNGYMAYILFIIQTENISLFVPNNSIQPLFGDALKHASDKGVNILAFDCNVKPREININNSVRVEL